MPHNKERIAMLYDAKEKLDKSLELNEKDPEVLWNLGEVYMFIIQEDFFVCQSNNLLQDYCTKAITYFDAARAIAPESEFGKDSTMFDAAIRQQEFLSFSSDTSGASGDDIKMELEVQSSDAEKACSENPGNAQAWKDWGMALIHLSDALDNEVEQKAKLYDAKKKFEKALELAEGDFDAMWKLGEVCMLIVRADSTIRQSYSLYKQYCTQAIDYFHEVRFRDSEYRRGSTGPLLAQQGLDYLSSMFPD